MFYRFIKYFSILKGYFTQKNKQKNICHHLLTLKLLLLNTKEDFEELLMGKVDGLH